MTGEGSVSLKAALDELAAMSVTSPAIDLPATLATVNETLFKIPGFVRYYRVGSAIIPDANPADVDIVVLVTDVSAAIIHLHTAETGWEDCGKEEYEMSGGWAGLKKDHLNLIITLDADWADRFERAALVCAYLRILDKETRKVVNQIIRDGRRP